jgi:opacity protein-like surface antigen
MTRFWRPLVLAAVLGAGTVRVATAQTVIVRHAPADTTVQVSFDAQPPVTATPDAAGNARATLDIVPGTDELAARVFLYSCPGVRQVAIVGRDSNMPPMPTGCTRRDLSGIFVVRHTTTLVLNLAEAIPFVLSAPGAPPHEWLRDPQSADEANAAARRVRAETFTAYLGSGLSNFRGVTASVCDLGVSCSGGDLSPGFTVGANYWFSPFIAADVSYGKDRILTANGHVGDSFNFTSTVDPEVLMLAAKIGVPVNARVTFYGKAGANHHRATTTNTDTLTDITVTVDGVSQTLPGGTLKTAYRTEGWGWLWGGGIDIHVTPHIGIYLDGRMLQLKGVSETGEFTRDTVATSVQAGIRLGLGH